MGSIATEFTPGNEYKLSRGIREHIRLNAQHHMLIWRQGWILHPNISEAIKDIPNPRIADVATGTGIWAIDVAEQLPHAEVVGLDISEEQFCPQWTLPSNVSLGRYDLLQEVPTDLRGQFDVVHVRLLLSAGPAVDKNIFLDRFRALLRPGGWLQWEDLKYPNVVACYPSIKQANGIEVLSIEDHPIMQAFAKYLALKDRVGWFENFDTTVAATTDYECVESNHIPIRRHLLQMESDSCVAVFTDLINMLIHNKNIQEPTILEELERALQAFLLDARKGVLFSYSWNVGIGKAA